VDPLNAQVDGVSLLSRQRWIAVLAVVGLLVSGGVVVGGIALKPSEAAREPVVLLTETFTQPQLLEPTKWVATATVGGAPTSAYPCLTAGTSGVTQVLSDATMTMTGCANPAEAAAGSGRLRLTPAANSYSSFFLLNTGLPVTDGIDIRFKMQQWAGTGADGISFFLKDGSNTDTSPGAPGGGLGYMCQVPTTCMSGGAPAAPGVKGALFGIGFDSYGNFNAGANKVTVRGGDTSVGQAGTSGYAVLGAANVSGLNGSTKQVRIRVAAAREGTFDIKVWVVPEGQPVDDSVAPTIVVSQPTEYRNVASFKFGWSASTGGLNNRHDISELVARAAIPPSSAINPPSTCSQGGLCVLGDIGPGGGTVFYDAGSTQSWGQYLEAAPVGWYGASIIAPWNADGVQDPMVGPWCSTASSVLLTQTGIGTGKGNTGLMVSNCLDNPTVPQSWSSCWQEGLICSSPAIVASRYRGGGKSDWYLPSKEELQQMYLRRALIGGMQTLTGTGKDWAWASSSEASTSQAWYVHFSVDNAVYVGTDSKKWSFRVRPIRAF